MIRARDTIHCRICQAPIYMAVNDVEPYAPMRSTDFQDHHGQLLPHMHKLCCPYCGDEPISISTVTKTTIGAEMNTPGIELPEELIAAINAAKQLPIKAIEHLLLRACDKLSVMYGDPMPLRDGPDITRYLSEMSVMNSRWQGEFMTDTEARRKICRMARLALGLPKTGRIEVIVRHKIGEVT